MTNTFLYRMPAGIPGAVNRMQDATILPEIIDSGTPPTAFGKPVKLVSGKVQPIASGDAATDVYGFLVRAYPATASQDGLGTSTPATSGIANVLKRGFMTVKLDEGTAVKGAAVYVRVTANTGPTRPVGNLATAADSAKCVVTGAVFMGPADADGNVEIAYNL